jgi:hypothetical protein
MTANNRAVALAALFSATLIGMPADASTQRNVPFEEKVEKAAAIVMGRCVKTEARWDENKRWIRTYSTFKVDRAIKGQQSGELTVVTPGGSVDGVHQETIGSPAFEPGSEHVLFVTNTAAGPSVLYLDQGAYDVVTDSRGEKIIEPMQSQSVRIDTQRGVAVDPEPAQSLKQFEGAVKVAARVHAQKMQIVRENQKKVSIWDIAARNKGLIALALIGAAIATWQLLKQR